MAVQKEEQQVRLMVMEQITQEFEDLEHNVEEDNYTPAGNLRSAPVYSLEIENRTLQKSKVLKDKSEAGVIDKAKKQLLIWAEQEIRTLTTHAKKDAKETAQAEVEEAGKQAETYLEELRNILNATLDFDDRINWKELEDHKTFREFSFHEPPKEPPLPLQPNKPNEPFFSFLIPSLKRKWIAACGAVDEQYKAEIERVKQAYQDDLKSWERAKAESQAKYEGEKQAFLDFQQKRNAAVLDYQTRFEAGDKNAILEYVAAVFERSSYPDDINLKYQIHLDSASQTLVVDVTLPNQESISDVCDYKYVAKTNSGNPVRMKKKDYDELYDNLVKQIIIRTIHEVFESVYTNHVMNVVANGWVTYVNKSTGQDQTSCIVSVSIDREKFESFNLARIDYSECIKAMKGLVAGPMSNIAPVRPIMQLNTEDDRFIESRAVLAEMNATTNLAEIPWEDFEHLVRDLFGKMFAGDGAEVRVTQASRDQGVDAIAFDPDPIRGGKFVIQAKRYTKTVGVAAVRELYGTMINEGAVKGILVTTSKYGRDSRDFVKDKPITLIDGPNLIYLLEQHGHKVRIDLAAARAKV